MLRRAPAVWLVALLVVLGLALFIAVAASSDDPYIDRERAIDLAEKELGERVTATSAEMTEEWPGDSDWQGEPVWVVTFDDGYCEGVDGPAGLIVEDPPGPCPEGTVAASADVVVHASSGSILATSSVSK